MDQIHLAQTLERSSGVISSNEVFHIRLLSPRTEEETLLYNLSELVHNGSSHSEFLRNQLHVY